jgi:Phage stabilisation protein
MVLTRVSQFNFIGGSHTAASVNQDAQRSYNLYPEKDESGTAKSKMMLVGTPGLVLKGTLPTSPIRGIFASGSAAANASRLFVVAGSKLYEIDQNAAIVGGTNRGDVGDDAAHSPVQMYANGNQLFVVSAGKAYIDNGGAASGSNCVAATYNPMVYTGTVNTSGPYVFRQTGDKFSPAFVGQTVTINGSPYNVFLVVSGGDSMQLSTSAGITANVAYSISISGANVLGTTGGFLDGYYITNTPNTTQFQISGINNGLDWNPIDFGVKEGAPDYIVSVLVDHEELWLFGDNTTEVWRNTGAATFPLQRDPGAFIQQGCGAPFSCVSLNNGVAWIGADTLGRGAAWYAQGYQPVRISTHAIESIWAGYRINDATAYVYEDSGHVFWVINFPTAGATWVYDATENLWHERGSLAGGSQGRHLANCHAYAFNAHYVGAFNSGKIYIMPSNAYDDDGATITRIRQAPHISAENNLEFHARFRLDAFNPGGGTPLNPTLAWSDNGGAAFINQRTTNSQAAPGVQLARYDWRRLGKSRDRVYQITITAACKVVLVNAYVDLMPGLS